MKVRGRPISKLGRLLSLIVIVSLLVIALEWYIYVSPDPSDHYSLRHSGSLTENSLAVFVLSNRNAFDSRESIRNTWALRHKNVFFVVAEQFCPLPPENRVIGTCNQNNYSLTRERLKLYIDREEMITKQILDEQDVILVHTGDDMSELPKKVTESYKWALQNLRAEWFLHVEDTIDVEIDKFEHYLKTTLVNSKDNVILSAIKSVSTIEREGNIANKSVFLGQFLCGLNHVVSRCVAQYALRGVSSLFEYKHTHNYTKIIIAGSINFTSEGYRNIGFTGKGACSTTTLQLDVCLQHNQTNTYSVNNSVKTLTSKRGSDSTYTRFENPSIYLNSDRFDLIVKMVYAYFYVFKDQVPKAILNAYTDHIRVWNNFNEYCNHLDKVWYDAKKPCANKRGSSHFISAFGKTIDGIRKFGFNSSVSRIPVDKSGFLLNGAHRVTASVVLSKYATFEHHNYEKRYNWGYDFFKQKGLSKRTSDFVMLEWFKQQMQLPYLKTLVSIISVFSNNRGKDGAMRKIVKEKCSKDNGILYETTVNVTKNGASQLITHMYGHQAWLENKIQHILSKFQTSTYSVLFLFVYGKDETELVQCKNEIRKLYNDKIFKSTVHIPDTAEENLILAEMILNPNSLQYLNHAKDSDCKLIAGEIATRSLTPPIKTLPQMYVGNDDIMVDSGAVLGFFSLRKRTDIDILFLHNLDKSILGDRHGLNIQAHAFKFNSISKERPWGEDHFGENGPVDQWDLFYDPENYGYCYGIKFVSLQQLTRYKMKRNDPKKDPKDVRLITELLKNVTM